MSKIDVLEDNQAARFQKLETGQQELRASVQKLQAGQLTLQSGQNQILAILTGKTRTND